MTSDGIALFQAVCENPADDTPRLVYADWLEEHDQPERAEFIRLQCEAWNLCPTYPTITEARNRASVLFKQYVDRWYDELPVVVGVTWSDLFVRGFVDTALLRGSGAVWVYSRRVPTGLNIASLTRVLDRAFSATPLLRLKTEGLIPAEVEELLAYPHLGRLASVQVRDLTEKQKELANATRKRCPGTVIS